MGGLPGFYPSIKGKGAGQITFDLYKPFPIFPEQHAAAPYRGYVAGVTPQEQWDNIPQAGKLQIIAFVGMLESYGEGAGNPDGYTHYTKGGLPGIEGFPQYS